MEAFVYCWTDKLTNKLYVGVHKGFYTDGYICSSKIMKLEYNKRPQDFSREIIASGIYKEMFNFEIKILQSINAAKDELFYNQHNWKSGFYYNLVNKGEKNGNFGKRGKNSPLYGRVGYAKGKKWYYNPITKKSKYFIVNEQPDGWLLGRGLNKQTLINMTKQHKGKKYFYGKKHTKESKEKNRNSHLGKKGPNNGKLFYHDPITNQNKMFFKNNQPTNFILGKKKKEK